jgi:hypothetical protein
MRKPIGGKGGVDRLIKLPRRVIGNIGNLEHVTLAAMRRAAGQHSGNRHDHDGGNERSALDRAKWHGGCLPGGVQRQKSIKIIDFKAKHHAATLSIGCPPLIDDPRSRTHLISIHWVDNGSAMSRSIMSIK